MKNAMSKIANQNVVYSGWLIKSPPESKFRLSGPWKIFRSYSQEAIYMDTSRWKRRFFVLFKPEGSLPHQYVLNYYNNEEGKRLKGVIDLEHCEQIIESLDLDLFPYLLAIKTFHKNRERTYFLAADTEEQMTTWVRNLCSVCGLKPEDNSPDLPPERDDNEIHTTFDKVTPSVTTQPISQRNSQPPVNRKQSLEEYVPLSNCSTGTRKPPLERPDSIDSVPDEIAPPPPTKKGQNIEEDDVFSPGIYDRPPKAHELNQTIPTPKSCTTSMTLDVYDVPPPSHPLRHSPTTPRSSSSESHVGDSAYSSQSGLTYDYPPSSEKIPVTDETYDYPPSHPAPKMDDVPPVRPPPPRYLQQQEAYQNLPPNSKLLSDGMSNLDINRVVPMGMTNLNANVPLSYDFPSNNSSTKAKYDFPNGGSNLSAVPPPGQCSVDRDQHSYINAATSRVSAKPDEDMYLPMDGVVPVQDRSSSSLSDSARSHDSYTNMSEVNVYDHPPPQRPPRLSKPVPPPCSTNGDAFTSIYKNERTRSFKKHNQVNAPPEISSRSSQRQTVLPPLPINTHPDLTTSSEESDDDHADINKNWNTVPPVTASPDSKEGELKYLELDLVDQSNVQPKHVAHSEQRKETPTEYREIDFVKTKALSEVKKSVEGQRKHDEN